MMDRSCYNWTALQHEDGLRGRQLTPHSWRDCIITARATGTHTELMLDQVYSRQLKITGSTGERRSEHW